MVTKIEKSERVIKAEQRVEKARERMKKAQLKHNKLRREKRERQKKLIGSIASKYLSEYERYDKEELDRILSASLKSRECQFAVLSVNIDSENEKADANNENN